MSSLCMTLCCSFEFKQLVRNRMINLISFIDLKNLILLISIWLHEDI